MYEEAGLVTCFIASAVFEDVIFSPDLLLLLVLAGASSNCCHRKQSAVPGLRERKMRRRGPSFCGVPMSTAAQFKAVHVVSSWAIGILMLLRPNMLSLSSRDVKAID